MIITIIIMIIMIIIMITIITIATLPLHHHPRLYPGWRDVRQWLSEGPHISAGLLWNDDLQREDNDKQDGWKRTKNLMARWAVPLEEAWAELWPRWARRGTESCGEDLCAGPLEHRLWFPRASGLGNLTRSQFEWKVNWICILHKVSTLLLFSLLLSLGLIVALVVVSNKTPAGHRVKITNDNHIGGKFHNQK